MRNGAINLKIFYEVKINVLYENLQYLFIHCNILNILQVLLEA